MGLGQGMKVTTTLALRLIEDKTKWNGLELVLSFDIEAFESHVLREWVILSACSSFYRVATTVEVNQLSSLTCFHGSNQGLSMKQDSMFAHAWRPANAHYPTFHLSECKLKLILSHQFLTKATNNP